MHSPEVAHMRLSSGTSPTPETMATNAPSHGTSADVNGLSHVDTAPSIDRHHNSTEKLSRSSAEKTLPSPPQHEPLSSRPDTIPGLETSAAEGTAQGRLVYDAPIHQPLCHSGIATAACAAHDSPQTNEHMLIDEPFNGREPPSIDTSATQAVSRDAASLEAVPPDDAQIQVTSRQANPQSPHLSDTSKLSSLSDVQRGLAKYEPSAVSTKNQSPCPSDTSKLSTLSDLSRGLARYEPSAQSPSSSDTSKLSTLSDLSRRLAGFAPSKALAIVSEPLDSISEIASCSGRETPSLAPLNSSGISQTQSFPGSPAAKSTPARRTTTAHKVKPKASIPSDIHAHDYAAQCIAAAEASRLNPYGLEVEEHAILRQHITLAQVTTYLNIRNGIVRLWLRKPRVAITRNEAIGCAKEARWFDLASLCFDWLIRRGYINYGCVEIRETAKVGRPRRAQALDSTHVPSKPRKRIVIIGAGMSGLGCARQLHNLSKQYRDQFDELGEQVPEVVVIEGRERVGGRVYSRAFEVQPKNPNSDFPQSHCTAEMGGMIVTGFERGNPMNTLIRGQLGLGYHALLSTTTIYDVGGGPVDLVRDAMVENLFNDCLDRVSEYKYKMPHTKTAQGNRDNIDGGRDSTSEGYRTVAQAEEAAAARAAASAAAAAARSVPGTPLSQGSRACQAATGHEAASPRADDIAGISDQSTARAHPEPAAHAARKAAQKVKIMGWDLKPGVDESRDLDLDPPTQAPGATFGYVVEEAIKQYSELVDLNAQDYRLLNWHVANLEYSNAINHNHLSLLTWDLDAGNEWDGPHSMIVGGYQSVARGLMLCPSPLDVRFKMVVKKITYACSDDADCTQIGRPPVVIDCENGERITADYVINTMPLGVLKHGNVEFNPPLPSWKSDAIGRIGFGVLNKIILTFRQPFWDTKRDIFGILRQPPNRFSLDQKDYARCRGRMFQWFNVTKTTGIPCLVALMAGDAAFDQEKTANDKLIAEATAVLRSVFGASRVTSPIEAVVTRWVSDEFARGSYSSAGPNMRVDDYDVMARPVGKHLHFAGEHTIGTYPATVHGAYLSGVRAASDLIDELLGPIQFPTPLVLAKEGAVTSHAVSSAKRKFANDYDDRRTPGDDSSSANGSVSGNGSGMNTATNSAANGHTSGHGSGSSSGHREVKANSRRRTEAREMRIMEYIVTRIGGRPMRPPKTGDTSYLLFSRANYDLARQKCDEGRRAGKGRALPNEVRALTSRMWRSAAPEERQPYAEQAALIKLKHDEAVQEFLEKTANWDLQATVLRAEYERDHPDDGVDATHEMTSPAVTTDTTPASLSTTPDSLATPSVGELDIKQIKEVISIAGLYEQPAD